ncbi:hypothetical protein RA28_19990 [Ruegeria sp. ANG-S4]|uniref:hypothetical protein n=1 Tax=Ruegeria sp. ANG-S4 TaxID=1577904 RepID=UPI00057CA424|nr:hypothetical protein [Ruegeria sp. ANG-S4]KIC41681.1 hypothetical protein RA28_19990 [Ruegeria sp. ANG-S4]
MRKVLLHLGLHKTGTTAAQSFLFENRRMIWPHHALVPPFRTRKLGLSDAATRYSAYGTQNALTDFTNRTRDLLATLDFGEKRGLILSEENFSGLRPSRNVAIGYEAAPELASCLIGLVRDRFAGEEVDITLYYSLRQRTEWLRSLWAHDLQRTRLLLDFDAFQTRMAAVPSPEDAVSAIRDRLPNVKIQSEWLHDLQRHRLGPGAPFAAFLNLPEDQAGELVEPARKNPALPEDVLDEMLKLNRSDLDEPDLIRQKQGLAQNDQKDGIGIT